MSNITKFENLNNTDGTEFVVDYETKLVYASESAIIRMLKAPRTTVQRRLKGCPLQDVLIAKIDTAGGLQGGSLYSAVTVFALALEFNIELAKAMGSAGANLYMLGLAGFKTTVVENAADVEHDAIRQQGKVDRLSITTVIKDAGGQSYDYARVTDDVYLQITGMTAKELKIDRNVPKKKPARDGLTTTELYAVSLAERVTASDTLPGSNVNQIRRIAINRAERIAAAIA